MIKRIVREMKLSQKRNPTKAVLIGLVLIVAANIVFSALTLNQEISDGIEVMNRYTRRTVYLEYENPVDVDPSLISKRTQSPIMYQKDVNKLRNYDMEPWNVGGSGSSGMVLLQTLRQEDEAFDQAKYDKGIESLNLDEDLSYLEIKTDYGNKFLSYDYMNHYKREFGLPEGLTIVEGDYFNTDHNLHLIVSKKFSEKEKLNVGENIDVTYDKRPITFEIVGIYESSSGLNEDVMIAAGGQKEISDTVTSLGSDYDIFYHELFTFDDDVTEYLPSMNEHAASVMDNIKYSNSVDRYSGFVRSLELIQTASLVFIIAIIILSVFLIHIIIVKDIKQYQKDAFVSIYDDDKKVIIISNMIQIVIISVIAISISIFTAPALNKIFTPKLVLNNVDYYNEMYEGVEITDYATWTIGSRDDALATNLSPDFVIVATMNYDATFQNVTLLFIIVLLMSGIGVVLGNKQLNRKE